MKKIKLLIALGALLTLVLLAFSSFAQSASAKNDNWVLLGSHVVDYTIDRDAVDLKENKELYTGLKFKVVNGPINLHKCTVHFGNGENQDVSFSTNPNDGHLIDLVGNNRKIDKVTLWYDTKNSSDKKAVVEVWGKK